MTTPPEPRTTAIARPGFVLPLTWLALFATGVDAQESDTAPTASDVERAPAVIQEQAARATLVDGGAVEAAVPRATGLQLPPAPLPLLRTSGGPLQGTQPTGSPSFGGALAPGCTAGEVYDDGVAEGGLGGCGFGTEIIVVNQFTPPTYPYSYDQVCVSWTQTLGDTDVDYDLVMYDDDGAGGGPGTLLGSIATSASGIPLFPAVSGFFDDTVAFPSVDSGDVWIGVRFDEAVDPCFFVSSDLDSSRSHYWSSDGGASFTLDLNGPQALLIRAEGAVTACADGESYDDGFAETGLGWGASSPDVAVVSRFTPASYPYNYDEICLSWTQTGGDTAIDYDLVVYDDDGVAGGPGTLLATVSATATNVPAFPEVSGLYSYAFPNAPAIYSGDVWIGARWNADDEPAFFIGADSNSNHPDYHTTDGGVTWTLDLTGSITLQIRAGGGEAFCADGEIYDDGIAEDGFGNTFTYVQVSQFTPSSYPFTYDEVCVGWTQTSVAGGTTDLDYTLVVYDDDGASGSPGTRLAEVDVSTSGIPDFFGTDVYAFTSHGLDCGPTVTSGSVWIGVEWDGIAQPGRFLALDRNSDHPDYTDQNGNGFVLDQPGFGTYMIRAGASGLGQQVDAEAVFRNAGSNPASLTTTLPIFGSTTTLTVDLSTTGHNFAYVGAYASPLTLTLSSGQTILHNIADPGGELLGLGLQTGPLATFTVQAPIDVGFCGFELFVQAAHIGGVQPFALSNAIDWTLGR